MDKRYIYYIMPDPIETQEPQFPIIFRYIVLLILFSIVFSYIYSSSAQYILFIITFILNFFTLIFLCRDMFTAKNISNALFNKEALEPDQKGILLLIFIPVIILTLLLNASSLIVMLIVFDTGTSGASHSHTITDGNVTLINTYNTYFIFSMIFIFILAFIIALTYAKDTTKVILANVGAGLTSITILGLSIYATITAVNFYTINKHNPLYK